MTRFHIASVCAVALVAGSARGQTWTGAVSTDWNTAGNWTNPATVPTTFTDVAFGATGVGNVSLSAGGGANSLTFNNSSGSYNITSSSATLKNLTIIAVSSTVSGVETINLANVPTGSLLFGASGSSTPLLLFNSSNSVSTSLVIGPNTVIGTPGSGGVQVSGPGSTQISGSFANNAAPNNEVLGGLRLFGPGTLTLSGNGTNLFGGLTLSGGTLKLDFSSNLAVKLGGGGLTSTGGTLAIVENSSTAFTQNFSSSTFSAGDMEITFTAGTIPTVGFGTMARSPGATFSWTAGTSFATTSTGSTNGLWGTGPAFAVIGTTWAGVSGGNLTNLAPGPTNTFSSGTNTDVSGFVAPAAFTTNSLRFNTFNSGLTLTGTNTLQSGGILVTTNAGITSISGGTLTSSVNEIIVHAYSDTYIYSAISASAGLTKAGPFTLYLDGNNGGLTGPININRGHLTVYTTNAVNSATTINFNDNRNVAAQVFTIDLGFGSTGTINAPVQFSAGGNPSGGSFNNWFSTGTSENSLITLSGVISSAPGTVSPIRFIGTQTNTSGFNLTNLNTFTGDINLFQGSLGILSDVCLGNAANTLYLDVGAQTGGLVFRNTGINVARPVIIQLQTPVVSNNGDVNTIFGPISGSGQLFKDGTGTLVLGGNNSQFGLAINAGTVRVGSDANLGSGALNINSGATLSASGSFFDNRVVNIGPFSGNVAGTATIAVDSGQTLTLEGQINGPYGALVKTGAGNLALASLGNGYTGGTTIQQGFIIATGDSSLGAPVGPVTIGVAGTLIYNGSTSTSRTFMNSGTLTAATGTTVSLNGASVYGGFLRGFGTFALSNGATLTGNSTFNTLSTTVTGTGSYINFSNGGSLGITAGTGNVATFNGFINQGSGAISAGAQSTILATDFQTYGTFSINPATVTENFSQTTLMTNFGASQLYFNGGSRTFLGTPGTAVFPSNWPDVALRGLPTFVAGIDLNGKNATVAGGLFVNNGYAEDTTNGGTGTAAVVADFGALVKGSGYFQNTVITQNGGKFQSGNSPGSTSFGRFVLGPGGVSSYVFAIDDATGTAGPTPDAAGHVSGWGLVKAIVHGTGAGATPGDFTWTATAVDRLLVSLQTLVNPTTVGIDVPGMMDHFDPNNTYVWPAITWTGSYAGPTDEATLDASTTFDASGFANPVKGTFGWALDAGGHTLSLTYTPSAVPEPGTLVLVVLATLPVVRRITGRRPPIGA
jgi:autotransporter-associated beta strand protein